MTAVVTVMTDFFMMVLCVTSAPADQREIRIDVIGNRGYVDTLIIRREKVGFTVYDETNGKLVKFATIVPKDGAENVFVCTDQKKGKSETIDLRKGIPGLKLPELRTKSRLRLKTTDGVRITVNRSKEVIFITPYKLKRTYVVH